MITAVVSVVSIMVKFINNIFMIAGMLFWIVALTSITILFVRIKPTAIIHSSSWPITEQYEGFEFTSLIIVT